MAKIDTFIKAREQNILSTWEALNKNGYPIEIFDVSEIFDLYFMYTKFPKQATWKEVFEFLTICTTEDLSIPTVYDKYRQRANRYFNWAQKLGYVVKIQNPDDKRSVLYTWTPKFYKLAEILQAVK